MEQNTILTISLQNTVFYLKYFPFEINTRILLSFCISLFPHISLIFRSSFSHTSPIDTMIIGNFVVHSAKRLKRYNQIKRLKHSRKNI
jgi:hypothetical protein